MPKTKKRKHLKISNTVSKIVLLFFLLSFGTVKNLNAQCPHTPKCPFDSCYYGGDGLSEATAFQIWSKAHLEELADRVNNATLQIWSQGKYFILMNNITDTVRTVIGNLERKFQGNFCGSNKIINLALTVNNAYVGLFGWIDTNGVVKNVEVNGNIYNEYFLYTVFPQKAGITAMNIGKISHCINRCSISIYSNSKTGDYAGGVVAINGNKGIVDSCLNSGNIEVFYHDVGGIAAQNYGTISNSTNTGSVTAKECGAGGVAGYTYSGSFILNCINTGAITAEAHVGGIAGGVYSAVVSNCSNYGFTKSNSFVGGISGLVTGGIINNNFNSGVVRGTSNVGCIVGKNNGGTLTNNHYDKQMCGEED